MYLFEPDETTIYQTPEEATQWVSLEKIPTAIAPAFRPIIA